jgi:hypothetical protein
MAQLVAESLNEHLDEGKLGRLAVAVALGAGLAFAPGAKAQAQSHSNDKNKTEISVSNEKITPLLRGVKSLTKSDGKYSVKVEIKNGDLSRLKQIGRRQCTSISNAEVQQQEKLSQPTTFKGTHITNADYFKMSDGSYIGEYTVEVTIPEAGA